MPVNVTFYSKCYIGCATLENQGYKKTAAGVGGRISRQKEREKAEKSRGSGQCNILSKVLHYIAQVYYITVRSQNAILSLAENLAHPFSFAVQ
jgi:uncharacterized membrane protein YiaA